MIQRKLSAAVAVLGLFGSMNAMALESGFYLGVVGAQGTADIDKAELDSMVRDPLATSFTSSIDDTDNAFGIVLGGQFGRWFAVEAQLLDLGEMQYKSTQSGVLFPGGPAITSRYDETVEAASGTLSGIVTIPVGDQVTIGVRLGVAFNASETKYDYEERVGNSTFRDSGGDDGDASDTGVTYGIGIEWDPTPHIGLRLEYQRITHVGGEDDDYDFSYYDEDEEVFYDDVGEKDGVDVDLMSLSLVFRF